METYEVQEKLTTKSEVNLAAHILMTDEGQPKIANVGYPDTKEDRVRYWAPELFVKQEYSKVSLLLGSFSS